MTDRRDDLIDETVLRRSLRLEPDEGGPRFDAAAIALLAAQRPAMSLRALGLVIAGSALLGFAAVGIWSSIFAYAPTVIDAALGALLDVLVAVATLLLPLADLAQEPVVPLSLVAALGVAILHELRERRERAHANAS
jgi:hypothetical protein